MSILIDPYNLVRKKGKPEPDYPDSGCNDIKLDDNPARPCIPDSLSISIGNTKCSGYISDKPIKIDKETTKQTKEEENIMNNTQRRIVTVELFDDSEGLPIENAVVAVFEGVVTEDDNATTIQHVLLTEDVKGKIEEHNKKRSEIVNEEVLNRTGNEVKLKPVQLKQLRWNVK